MSTLTVSELWRYPVKSMRGERLEAATLTASGIAFDRGWAVRDETARTIRGAKRLAELLQCSARYLTEEPADGLAVPHAAMTFPDGETINTDDTRVNGRLSELVGRAVTLWPLQPRENEDHYRINEARSGDFASELRKAMALRDDEPLPDFSGFPPNLVRQLSKFVAPPGTYFDAFAVDILTEASLRFLQRLMPESIIDVRRFRPNILIADEAGAAEPLEEGWIGRALSTERASLRVVVTCPRCVMVTREQADIPADAAIMRTLVRETRQNLSVYCDVTRPGVVRVGEAVHADA